MPGPYSAESTWPRITDGPSWPGVGEYLYQPARESRASGGTCTVRSGLSPSCGNSERTSIAGISSVTGTDLANTRCSEVAGAGRVLPVGAGCVLPVGVDAGCAAEK